jgi:cellulose synthase/poly-beta-1,6-N-acetylglucosamine synthase-like glycosyltransferase
MLFRFALLAAALIAAIWVGYPLVIRLLATVRRVRHKHGTPQFATPTVSVVLATREAPEAVLRRVNDLLDTTYPQELLEVVVAIDRAQLDVNARGLALFGGRVHVVPAETDGKPGALNAGVRAATGDVLVFADTFQSFDRDTIPVLVEALADPSLGAVSGRLSLPPERSLVRLYWSLERRLREWEARVHSAVGVTGACWAMRRSLWLPLPDGLLLDDVYTAMRLVLDGYRVGFAPGARATETRPTEPHLEYRRKVRTLTGVLQLCAWLPGVLVPGRNPIVGQFVFHKLARLATPYLLLPIAVWITAMAASMPGPFDVVGAGLLLVLLIWLLMTHRPTGIRIRRLLTEAVLIQVAALMAGLNAVRGRWQVWGG